MTNQERLYESIKEALIGFDEFSIIIVYDKSSDYKFKVVLDYPHFNVNYTFDAEVDQHNLCFFWDDHNWLPLYKEELFIYMWKEGFK